MKKILILLLTLIVFFSCVVEEETSSSEPEEPTLVDVSIDDTTLSLVHINTDLFLYNKFGGSRFYGIVGNQEIEIPVNFDIDFNLPEDSYGYTSSIERVSYLNDRYDLLKGNVTKFLNYQQIERNDTIFSIEGFYKQTEGNYLIFDKQTFDFVELEDDFYLNNFFSNSLQVIDDKFYYVKNPPGASQNEIKWIDLNGSVSESQSYYSAPDINSFLFNANMDIFYYSNANSTKTYVSHETNNEFQHFDPDNPLKSHFVGLDGKFYAQNYLATLEQLVKGFFTIDVTANGINPQEIYAFNDDDYEGVSYLGDSDIVISNPIRNTNLIIGTNTGTGSMYIYEFNANNATINPIAIELNGVGYVSHYQNDFFIVVDYSGDQGDIRLRKINMSNYSIEASHIIGISTNGVLVNQIDGATYALVTDEQGNRILKIDSNNLAETIELSEDVYGYFSVIN